MKGRRVFVGQYPSSQETCHSKKIDDDHRLLVQCLKHIQRADDSKMDKEEEGERSLTLQGLELDNDRLSRELDTRRAINSGSTWSSLTSLDLSRNAVTELPATAFSELPSLTHLDVSRNRLRYLPEELGALSEVICVALILSPSQHRDKSPLHLSAGVQLTTKLTWTLAAPVAYRPLQQLPSRRTIASFGLPRTSFPTTTTGPPLQSETQTECLQRPPRAAPSRPPPGCAPAQGGAQPSLGSPNVP